MAGASMVRVELRFFLRAKLLQILGKRWFGRARKCVLGSGFSSRRIYRSRFSDAGNSGSEWFSYIPTAIYSKCLSEWDMCLCLRTLGGRIRPKTGRGIRLFLPKNEDRSRLRRRDCILHQRFWLSATPKLLA